MIKVTGKILFLILLSIFISGCGIKYQSWVRGDAQDDFSTPTSLSMAESAIADYIKLIPVGADPPRDKLICVAIGTSDDGTPWLPQRSLGYLSELDERVTRVDKCSAIERGRELVISTNRYWNVDSSKAIVELDVSYGVWEVTGLLDLANLEYYLQRGNDDTWIPMHHRVTFRGSAAPPQ